MPSMILPFFMPCGLFFFSAPLRLLQTYIFTASTASVRWEAAMKSPEATSERMARRTATDRPWRERKFEEREEITLSARAFFSAAFLLKGLSWSAGFLSWSFPQRNSDMLSILTSSFAVRSYWPLAKDPAASIHPSLFDTFSADMAFLGSLRTLSRSQARTPDIWSVSSRATRASTNLATRDSASPTWPSGEALSKLTRAPVQADRAASE
mmetsp:Transcript_19028/g.39155  ORF Transcript_19028/g.39155 Transcript_19028/m.39155 type:complete len:210 (-) Transcript_19028:926-1555(-)